jgi:hypothetical protein
LLSSFCCGWGAAVPVEVEVGVLEVGFAGVERGELDEEDEDSAVNTIR